MEIRYGNSFKSKLMFRCRINSLQLNLRKRFIGEEEKCVVCHQEEQETLQHFLLQCGLDDVRRKYEIEEDTRLEKVLLFHPINEEIDKCTSYVEVLWETRKRKIGLAPNQPQT